MIYKPNTKCPAVVLVYVSLSTDVSALRNSHYRYLGLCISRATTKYKITNRRIFLKNMGNMDKTSRPYSNLQSTHKKYRHVSDFLHCI